MEETPVDPNEPAIGALARTLVRPVVTVAVIGTACFGFVTGLVDADVFMAVVASTTGFWFGARGTSS